MNIAYTVIHFWEILLWLGWQQQTTTNMQIMQSGEKINKSPNSLLLLCHRKWKDPTAFLPRIGTYLVHFITIRANLISTNYLKVIPVEPLCLRFECLIVVLHGHITLGSALYQQILTSSLLFYLMMCPNEHILRADSVCYHIMQESVYMKCSRYFSVRIKNLLIYPHIWCWYKVSSSSAVLFCNILHFFQAIYGILKL